MKKLYRSKENKKLAGVLGGLGEYLEVDPAILRLTWIVLTVFSGVVPGVIAYFIALFVVPNKI